MKFIVDCLFVIIPAEEREKKRNFCTDENRKKEMFIHNKPTTTVISIKNIKMIMEYISERARIL